MVEVSRVVVRALAAAASLLVGCGGGSELPRAKAPGVPDQEARCGLAARNESPLVTEWSPAEKANLQARLRSGALAVEFTGCSMRPILGCTVRGSYRWQRTTLSSESIEIHSQDELFAKLPLGAIALEGELARSGRLAVRTAVGGQYVLEGSSAADVPDYGDCSAATHLLVGVSIGSFKLHSGGTLQAGGSIGAGMYQAGAHTNSSESLLREAGDFDSCKSSTDETPELNCSSPVQAFLAPLPRFAKERGSGTLRATFAAGSGERTWELRQNQQFVCRTPCTRWINPSESYQMRTETGPDFQTLEVPNLARYSGSSELEVRAYERRQGKLVTGIALAGSGGMLAFMGGFLALAGGLSERSGLSTAGAITAGTGLVMLVPGVYLIAGSGSKTEVYTDRGLIEARLAPTAAPGFAVGGSL
ncbi:MAG TPA: hypothetical protein VFK05_00200 [Polyangiaceae bacterium]|nr:hypothetical protein [Polyangiaceae bacterium]